MRSMSLVTAVLLLVSSAWAAPSRSRLGRSQYPRRADSAQPASPQAGAWIRTAGAGWKVEAGSPQRHQFVDGGGFIAGAGPYLNPHPGVQTIAHDKSPAAAAGPVVFGRNVILPNDSSETSSSGGSSGPPFPGGASGQTPNGNSKNK